ncbi:MAG: flagellar hook-associated protein FlgK [Halioglobus sp.]|nr:flagellar hook-associated protein FlgK [Halioglobus sp.]
MGTSGLLSLQRAINTTGHNIANVNTEGYSRQRVNFDTRAPQLHGSHYMGTGVATDSVQRVYNQYLAGEVRERTSSQAGFETFHQLSSRLDNLLADPAVGLAPALDNFFGALQGVSNNPGSLPEREALLGEAQVLADRFHYLDGNFSDLGAQINARIDSAVLDINALARGIADLNQQVVSATATSGGQPPNDLLDARDQLIDQLSARIGIATTTEANGAVNVMIGNGQSLVVGFTSSQLQTFTDPLDSNRILVGGDGPGGITDLARFLGGGELGAVLDFRQQVLDPARNQLGLLATGMAASFNAQHALGVDLAGAAGGAFFAPLSAATSAYRGNSGASSVSVAISDPLALTGDDYSLRYDGAQYVLTNLGTNATQSGAGPFIVDGLTVSTAGAPVSGDGFLIQPTAQGAAQFNVALHRPQDIAAAAPLRSQALLGNSGSAALDSLVVSDASGLPLAGPVTLSFDPDALGPGVPGFTVAGMAGGPLAYDPATDSAGVPFSLGGFDFTLSGVPGDGDSLIVENNSGGSGDNRNALALAALQDARQLLGGSASYQDVYGALVADVGVKTRQAESSAGTEKALLQQAVAAREGVSGVNLDEEAANLMRFQQAYQAAAQVIAVADEVFQTLLNATRR